MRATNGAARHQSQKKLFRRAKGFRGANGNHYRTVLTAVMRAERNAFVGRRLKKREFRSLWITRLNTAARELGLSYSRLIAGLAKADIRMDRKQLSELSIHQPQAFAEIIAKVKAALG
jgi:large subunit ribosomal protein L20